MYSSKSNSSKNRLKHKIVRGAYAIPSGRLLIRLYAEKLKRNFPDVFVVSFPKSGRTWLRVMLGSALKAHFNIQDADIIKWEESVAACPSAPRINFTHEPPVHFGFSNSFYRDKKIVLLVRDPRDVIVSLYFERTRRNPSVSSGYDQTDMGAFARASIGPLLDWYNLWAVNGDLPAAVMVVQYELLHQNAVRELYRVLDFIGLSVDERTVHQAVEFASFDNMRRMESARLSRSFALQAGNTDDPESFKTRRGKLHGYFDYLSNEDIQFLNQEIQANLVDVFGYYKYSE